MVPSCFVLILQHHDYTDLLVDHRTNILKKGILFLSPSSSPPWFTRRPSGRWTSLIRFCLGRLTARMPVSARVLPDLIVLVVDLSRPSIRRFALAALTPSTGRTCTKSHCFVVWSSIFFYPRCVFSPVKAYSIPFHKLQRNLEPVFLAIFLTNASREISEVLSSWDVPCRRNPLPFAALVFIIAIARFSVHPLI